MTVFSMRGSKILTDKAGQITDIQDTVLEAITRIGTNSLEVAYLGDPQNPFAISLSDYNLLFDKVHINDADLPAHVEFFDLSASDGYNARALNFVFETENGIEERMFSVGNVPLPQFQSASEASLFFAQHEPVKVAAQDDWTIHFDQISGVETKGVVLNLDKYKAPVTIQDDDFDFIDMDTASDLDVWDVEFANAAQLEHAFAASLGDQSADGEATAEEALSDIAQEQTTDPSIIELGQG